MNRRRLARICPFLADARGVAAVEMALISPVIAAMAVAMFAAWDTAARVSDMRGGLKGGAQYYMNGGLSDDAAKSVAMSAWLNRPDSASVTVTRSCRCGEAPQACETLCPDGLPPAVYVTLAATSNEPTAVVAKTLDEEEVVRVR